MTFIKEISLSNEDDSKNESEEIALLDSAKSASLKAIRVSKALGIIFAVIKNREILLINPDNSFKVLRKISKPKIGVRFKSWGAKV